MGIWLMDPDYWKCPFTKILLVWYSNSHYHLKTGKAPKILIILHVVIYRVDITLVYYSAVWSDYLWRYGQKFGFLFIWPSGFGLPVQFVVAWPVSAKKTIVYYFTFDTSLCWSKISHRIFELYDFLRIHDSFGKVSYTNTLVVS